MAWNEPGNNGDGNGNDNDPWGGGRRDGNKGPPDIDEVIRNLTKKFGGLFGGFGGGSGGTGTSSGGSGLPAGLIAGFVVAAVVIWGFMGIYQVDQAERGVVLRFGRVLDTIVPPGLHWNPLIIDEVTLVNVEELQTRSYRNDMLTTDENIVTLAVAVQYRILDPMKYVLRVQEPERSLDNAAESAIRHEVGGNEMNNIFTIGRDAIANGVQDRLQNYMDVYNTGILVSQVNVTDAQPPDAVRGAFDDVIRAREDEARVQNEAQQYANRIIPVARGEAQQAIEQANAYQQEVIARAEGDASRFDQLREQYAKAKGVTRERLYIDAAEAVMSNTSKILMGVEGGNNMLYLPLDQMMQRGAMPLGQGALNSDQIRDLANELAPFLPGPSTANSVDRSRLPTGRGR